MYVFVPLQMCIATFLSGKTANTTKRVNLLTFVKQGRPLLALTNIYAAVDSVWLGCLTFLNYPQHHHQSHFPGEIDKEYHLVLWYAYPETSVFPIEEMAVVFDGNEATLVAKGDEPVTDATA